MFLIDFIKYGYRSIKYGIILKNIYKNEQFPEKLSQLLNCQFKIDHIGRLYTILNPIIIYNNDSSSIQFEYDLEGNMHISSASIEKWIMERLNIALNYIMAENLFDLLTYTLRPVNINDINKIKNINLERLGENYIFIIEPTPYNIFFKACKKTIIFFIFIFIILLLILFFI